MNEKILKPIKSGEIKIGDMALPCAVLEDETRILSERGVTKVLGGKRGGAHWRRKKENLDGANLPVYLSATNLKPFISEELELALTTPIKFYTGSKLIGNGVRADVLPDICVVWLNAKEKKVLHPTQFHIAEKAQILHRALAKTGIIALIDEATGFQYVRDSLALQRILEAYISSELIKWQKRFPDEWYENLYKLWGWEWKGRKINPPQLVGKITNDIIYERLPNKVLEELKRKSPPNESGNRKNKLHQWLTPEIGHPKLQEIITGTNTLMKISPNWRKFKEHLSRAFPRHGEQQSIELDV